MSWKVFAEDEGTGLQDQTDHDYGDGANFGAHVHSPNDTEYSPVAPTLTTDYTAPEVTLGEAQYKLRATNVSGRERGGTQTTWPEATFVAKAPQTTVSLTDNTVNYIYVSVDLTTTGDDGQYVVKTTDSAPAEPSLKVAEVDTSADTTDVVNQNPDAEFESLSTDQGHLKIQSNHIHYAEEYDGSDPDTRLSNAISAAVAGDVVIAEPATTYTGFTIGKKINVRGPTEMLTNASPKVTSGSIDITKKAATLQSFNTDVTMNIDADDVKMGDIDVFGGSIIVSGNNFVGQRFHGGSLTFESGTDGGIVDTCSSGFTVTDNGTNTVGDIA